MSRRSVACFGITALAVAALLVVAEPASAQRMGWGGRGSSAGYSPWTGYSAGYGSPYYGGYGLGNYPQYYGGRNYYGWSNWNNYPAYSGNRNYSGWQNYPGTGWYNPGTAWSGNQYTGNAPSYYSEGMNEGMQGEYAGSTAGEGYGGQAYGAMASQMDNKVLITMRVPQDAQVWFDGEKTTQTGTIRSYISPPLNTERDFAYQVRVQWKQNGREMDRTRKVEVHAGDRLFVNFMQPASQGGTSTGQYGTSDQAGGHYGNTAQNRSNPEAAPSPPTHSNPQEPNQSTNPPPTRPTNQPKGSTPPNPKG